MIFFRFAFPAIAILLLAGCGGGGSSDGGGSDDGGGDAAQFAGTYEGTITATVSAQGENQTLARDIRFVVAEDGRTIRVDNEVFPLEGTMFDAELPLSLSNNQTTCILNTQFNGTISMDLISGVVNGNGDCLVDGVGVVNGEISGYSGASRI